MTSLSTGGKELPEMWTLTDRNTPELLNTLNNRYNINAGSVKECIEAMTANSINSAPIAESSTKCNISNGT